MSREEIASSEHSERVFNPIREEGNFLKVSLPWIDQRRIREGGGQGIEEEEAEEKFDAMSGSEFIKALVLDLKPNIMGDFQFANIYES